MGADFFSLQCNRQGVLGLILLICEEFFLMHGQTDNKLAGEISRVARFIGFLAVYHMLDGIKWLI
ncbi:type VI secretion lipoprotein TssJ [Erwinia amylovora]|nr:type VI secretion lipoprotein TssJ [Erwinia amylovora]